MDRMLLQMPQVKLVCIPSRHGYALCIRHLHHGYAAPKLKKRQQHGKMQTVMAKPARTMMKSVMVEDTMLDTQKTFEEQQIQEGKVVKVMSKGQSAGHCAVVYDACSVVKENGQQCGEKDCCEHLGAATVPRYRVRIQLVKGPELADSMWADVWGEVAEGLFKMSAPEMNNRTGVEVEDAKAGTIGKVYELTLRAQYREAKRKSGAALQFVSRSIAITEIR